MAEGLAGRLAELGVYPADASVYEKAFRHRSTGRRDSNEVLEFLGDAVLATAVSHYLTLRYPASDEGFLTRMRTKMVRGSTQTAIARRIGLGRLVELSEEAEASGKRDSDAVLEDTLEALLGAMFLDRGFDSTARWIRGLYETHMDFSDAVQDEVSDKERLTRLARQHGDELEFDHVRLVGERHKIIIRSSSGSSPAGFVVGVGEGPSKKDATDDACRRGLRRYTAASEAAPHPPHRVPH